jgi:predicted adenylyl cyclase CyaB
MAFEVESKAWVADPAALEERARMLGQLKKESAKEDVYYRRKGEISAMPLDRFRLRREHGQAVVTYKDKLVTDDSEVNDEVEYTVDNPFNFFRFADRLGFEPFVVKRKKSRVYQIERASVELNEVEHLGHFVEIEILVGAESEILAARAEIARTFYALGLPAESIERRYYIDMLQQAYPVRFRFVNDPALDWPFEEIGP